MNLPMQFGRGAAHVALNHAISPQRRLIHRVSADCHKSMRAFSIEQFDVADASRAMHLILAHVGGNISFHRAIDVDAVGVRASAAVTSKPAAGGVKFIAFSVISLDDKGGVHHRLCFA